MEEGGGSEKRHLIHSQVLMELVPQRPGGVSQLNKSGQGIPGRAQRDDAASGERQVGLEHQVGPRSQGASLKEVRGQWKPGSAPVCLVFEKDPSDTSRGF